MFYDKNIEATTTNQKEERNAIKQRIDGEQRLLELSTRTEIELAGLIKQFNQQPLH